MTSLLLVGCGNMGGALLARWKEKLPDVKIDVVEPRGEFFHDLASLPASAKPDVILFAVKPQSLAEILPAYKTRFRIAPLYLSIAAGKTISFFEKHLGVDARIIRAMPNTPAMVGKAMTGLCANANVMDTEKQLADSLLTAAGKTIWGHESQMDAITAISGSGPAYVFLFLEALTKAATQLGLGHEQAQTLALQTLHGATHLAEKSTVSLEQLRKNVTSPGGTTEAALAVLMKAGALEKLLADATAAAANRANILSE